MTAEKAVPRARHIHSTDEVEEHPAPPARRGTDYPLGAGVLRLEKKFGGRNRIRNRRPDPAAGHPIRLRRAQPLTAGARAVSSRSEENERLRAMPTAITLVLAGLLAGPAPVLADGSRLAHPRVCARSACPSRRQCAACSVTRLDLTQPSPTRRKPASPFVNQWWFWTRWGLQVAASVVILVLGDRKPPAPSTTLGNHEVPAMSLPTRTLLVSAPGAGGRLVRTTSRSSWCSCPASPPIANVAQLRVNGDQRTASANSSSIRRTPRPATALLQLGRHPITFSVSLRTRSRTMFRWRSSLSTQRGCRWVQGSVGPQRLNLGQVTYVTVHVAPPADPHGARGDLPGRPDLRIVLRRGFHDRRCFAIPRAR